MSPAVVTTSSIITDGTATSCASVLPISTRSTSAAAAASIPSIRPASSTWPGFTDCGFVSTRRSAPARTAAESAVIALQVAAYADAKTVSATVRPTSSTATA
jgi:hypothetical protein